MFKMLVAIDFFIKSKCFELLKFQPLFVLKLIYFLSIGYSHVISIQNLISGSLNSAFYCYIHDQRLIAVFQGVQLVLVTLSPHQSFQIYARTQLSFYSKMTY